MIRGIAGYFPLYVSVVICSATERKLIFHVCKVQGMEVAISEI
jgi:hypothetical protein